MILTDLKSRTGRRVVDLRQPLAKTVISGESLNHSFKPIQTSATTATVTAGMVYDRYGQGRSITTATDWALGVIDFTTFRRWYLQIRYLSSPVGSAGEFDAMQWVGTAGAFPDLRPSLYTVNIPVLELSDGTWASLIRYQTSHIYEVAFRHNDLGGPIQGGDATLDEHYHLTAAQVELIDTSLPLPYPPQDPDQPWPGDEYPIQDPDEPWPTPGDHATLSDVTAQTVGDDHRGNRTTAAPISEGTPAVAGHPYIHANGNETRNRMTTAAYIGDNANAKSIWPAGRQLMNGATVIVDWILRKLSGGAWTITDTTAASGSSGTSAGALVVDGGVNIKDNLIVQDDTAVDASPISGAIVASGGAHIAKGVYVIKSTADAAGVFVDNAIPGYTVTLSGGGVAGTFVRDEAVTDICNASYGIQTTGDVRIDGIIYDSAGNKVIDLLARKLYATDGTTVVLDWSAV
jgi:hypothetical protein